MSLGSIIQDNFSRGIVRQVEGQRIPTDGAYDIVNGLLDDDMAVVRRGGSAYLTSLVTSADNLTGVWSGQLATGERTVVWNATTLWVINASAQPFGVNTGPGPTGTSGRPVSVAGYLFVSDPSLGIMMYAGGLGTTSYAIGTVTATAGSKDVTGVGTDWSPTNVMPGAIFSNGGFYAVVESVTDDTNLVLKDPWPGATGTGGGFSPAYVSIDPQPENADAIGTAARRLLIAAGPKVYMTPPLDSSSMTVTLSATEDFFLLPESASVLGIEGLGDSALLFTTVGVFRRSNLAYDLTDAYGNSQQSTDQINKDMILWGERGLAAYRGRVVVPAVDDVFLFGGDGSQTPVSGDIRPLYRSYVKAGYSPGYAAVHRNTYLLPIWNGSSLVDVLVCRLDGENPGWTRWAGHAASMGYTQRVGASTRSPKLYGVADQLVTDLSGCFTPESSNKNDADGTTHVLTVVTRDFAVKAQVSNLWKYLRARFELTDAGTDNPTLTAEYAVGPPESESWTSIGSWSEGTGETSTKLSLGKRAQSIRFRLKTSGPSSRFRLRSLEVFFRPRNRP